MRIILLAIFFALPCAMAPGDPSADTQDSALQAEMAGKQARDAYQKAQALKLENRFNEAREQFTYTAALKEPGTGQWADLAADELDYGLLLHEANYWVLKLGRQQEGAFDDRLLQCGIVVRKRQNGNVDGLAETIR